MVKNSSRYKSFFKLSVISIPPKSPVLQPPPPKWHPRWSTMMSCCYLEHARMKSTKRQPKTMAVNWIQRTNPLSSVLGRKWNAFLLPQVKELSILRHLCTESDVTVSFCLFSDVSELGYAANVYVCCAGIVWCVRTHSLFAKSRVICTFEMEFCYHVCSL